MARTPWPRIPAFSGAWLEPLPGDTAYNFPGGTNTAVVIPYNAVLAQNAAFSVEFWAKAEFPQHIRLCLGTPTAFIDYNSPRRGWLIYQSDSGLNYGAGWIFRLYRNSSTTLLADAEIQMPVDANMWYHIVCVWDGTNAKIYTNGVQAVSVVKLTGTYTAATSARALTIGSRGNSGSAAVYEYSGVIDEYAYYTNALTAAIVAAHYAAATTNAPGYAAQILTSKPAGYWRFNEKFNPTTVANLGTGGSAFNGTYRQGATTARRDLWRDECGQRGAGARDHQPRLCQHPPVLSQQRQRGDHRVLGQAQWRPVPLRRRCLLSGTFGNLLRLPQQRRPLFRDRHHPRLQLEQ